MLQRVCTGAAWDLVACYTGHFFQLPGSSWAEMAKSPNMCDVPTFVRTHVIIIQTQARTYSGANLCVVPVWERPGRDLCVVPLWEAARPELWRDRETAALAVQPAVNPCENSHPASIQELRTRNLRRIDAKSASRERARQTSDGRRQGRTSSTLSR